MPREGHESDQRFVLEYKTYTDGHRCNSYVSHADRALRAGPCPYRATPREEDSTGSGIGRRVYRVEKAGHGCHGAAVKILPELFARVRKT